MGGSPVMPKVVKFLLDHIGQNVTVEQIAKATKLEAVQIRQAMRRVVMNGQYDIDTVTRGHVWRINSCTPAPVEEYEEEQEEQDEPSGEMQFEVVGQVSSGEFVVRDPNGTLYKLIRL